MATPPVTECPDSEDNEKDDTNSLWGPLAVFRVQQAMPVGVACSHLCLRVVLLTVPIFRQPLERSSQASDSIWEGQGG